MKQQQKTHCKQNQKTGEKREKVFATYIIVKS